MDKYIEALNRLDEFASQATQDNDNGEANQQERDYNLLFNFLRNNQSIRLPLSASDLEELRDGRTFDWTFTTNKGQDIDIKLVPEEEGEE